MENLVKADLTIYKGKKVFITGHSGFKGSWLVLMLQKLGAIIKGYSLKPDYNNILFDYILSNNTVDTYIGDIRNEEGLKRELLSFQPDFIFHLAAQPLVRESYENPIATFDINVTGTAKVLEAARNLRKQVAIVVVTTDKVYENKEWFYPYRENDRLGGHDPYSASKAACEIVVQSYYKSYFHISEHSQGLATARAGNVIGGGDFSKDRIIPDIVRSINNNAIIEIRSPKSIRPWQHVLEPLGGYLLLGAKVYAEPKKYSKAYNFGPDVNQHYTVQEVVDTIIKLWQEGSYHVNENTILHEAGKLLLDNSLAKNELGWQPLYNIEEALTLTINWYSANPSEQINITQKQIIDFLNRQ